MGDYFRPQELSEATDLLANRELKILAGGTDYYPAKVGKPLDDDILDVTAINALSGIENLSECWRIGATTRWSDIIKAPLPRYFDGLKLAAGDIGGRQIQNSGTIGGNLCNASPAADGVPVLLCLGAEVEITNHRGLRRLDLSEFILGNRRTDLSSSDILTALYIPKLDDKRSKGSFLKLGSRKYLVISLAMVGGTVSWDEKNRIIDCKIAVGACSEVAQRLPQLEDILLGADLSSDLVSLIDDMHFENLSPIDDVRATAEYRRDMPKILVRRMLEEWRHEHDG